MELASSPASVYPIQQAVQAQGWDCVDLSTEDLEQGTLLSSEVTVLLLPGGKPRQMKDALTPTARRSAERWKCQSKDVGLIGICAGAFVAVQKGFARGIWLVDDNRFASTGLSSMVGVKLSPSMLPHRLCINR